MARSWRTAIAERLASTSWQAALGCSVAFGALSGPYYGHVQDGSPVEMLRNAVVFAAVAAVYAVVALRVRLAAVWALPAAQRRVVIDAVRFGRPLDDRDLDRPMLRYTASAAKRVRRSVVTIQTAVLGIVSGYGAFVAIRVSQVGWVFDTVVFGVISLVFAGLAVVWPEFGRVSRRNIAAAQPAADGEPDAPKRLVRSGIG